jgi:hypothetical protein
LIWEYRIPVRILFTRTSSFIASNVENVDLTIVELNDRSVTTVVLVYVTTFSM